MPAAGVPVPACFELAAQPGWEAIDFISDLHLCAGLPSTFEVWSAYLKSTPADAVFILGDLFEVWVGDDARQLPFEAACVDVMAAFSLRKPIWLMVGNRDFLMGDDLQRACGATALPDPTVLSAWGQRILLTHGDALCIADAEYQLFRSEVRSPRWRQDFLARSLPERLSIAAEIRRQSQTRQRYDGSAAVDADAATAVGWMQAMSSAQMVHGHTHRPGSNTLAAGYERHVLSDWDLDDAIRPRAQVLRLSRQGLMRVNLDNLARAQLAAP